jgi:hypothetical protein
MVLRPEGRYDTVQVGAKRNVINLKYLMYIIDIFVLSAGALRTKTRMTYNTYFKDIERSGGLG